jgi:hypothetical protein
MGSRSFQRQNGLFRRFKEILEFLECFRVRDRASCRVWEFFGDFCGILDGLEWFSTYS